MRLKFRKQSQLPVQFGQGFFKHFAVTGVACGLNLRQSPLSGEFQSISPPGLLRLLRRGPGPSSLGFTLIGGLLLFNRFAFPASGHKGIVAVFSPVPLSLTTSNMWRKAGDLEYYSGRCKWAANQVCRTLLEGERIVSICVNSVPPDIQQGRALV